MKKESAKYYKKYGVGVLLENCEIRLFGAVPRKLRHMTVFIVLNQCSENLDERREWMRFILANLIDQIIQHAYNALVLLLAVRYENGRRQATPRMHPFSMSRVCISVSSFRHRIHCE